MDLAKIVLELVEWKLAQDLDKMECILAPGALVREFKQLQLNAGRKAGHTTAALELARKYDRRAVVCVAGRGMKSFYRRRRLRVYALCSQDDLGELRRAVRADSILIVDDASYADLHVLDELQPRLRVFLG